MNLIQDTTFNTPQCGHEDENILKIQFKYDLLYYNTIKKICLWDDIFNNPSQLKELKVNDINNMNIDYVHLKRNFKNDLASYFMITDNIRKSVVVLTIKDLNSLQFLDQSPINAQWK